MSSLIEYDANTQLDPEFQTASLGESDDGMAQTNLLKLAWRARWLMLLTTLLGLGAAWALLQRVEQRFTSISRIYVEQNAPRLLGNNMQIHQAASYLYKQAELIRSIPVLAEVARAPKNEDLESFRDVESRIGFLKEHIEVQVGQEDDIISVWTELPNAEEAAQLVNSVVESYTNKYVEQNQTKTVEVLKILRNQKQRRDEELRQQQQALEKFREQNGSLALQDGADNVITKRFSKLSAELNETETLLLGAKAHHNRIQQMYKAPSQRPYLLEMASAQQHAALEIRVENQLLIDFEKQIQATELQLATERATWGDGHPRVKLILAALEKLQQRVEDQQQSIDDHETAMIEGYVENTAQQFKVLEQTHTDLQRKYDKQFKLAMQVNSQSIKLQTLKDALDRTVRRVDILDDRIKEVNLSEDVGAMNVTIMEKAGPSIIATYPKQSKFLALGTLLGGLVGFGLAWLRDLLDHRLRSLDEIASTLQLPVVGALPLAGGRLDRSQLGKIMLVEPRSKTSEAFRTLRTAIHFGMTGNESKIIAVTSPLSAEGKSIVASNLAIALAQVGQKVLLVDADFRRSSQSEIFDVEDVEGLSAVLSNRQSVDDALRPTSVSMLDLLPSGPQISNPVELLSNGYFDDLLDELRGRYDKIVIDTPSVLPVADARIIASLSDAVLLVLQAENSTKRDSLAARDELMLVGVRKMGVVVNRIPGSKQSDYGQVYGDLGYSGEVGEVIEDIPEQANSDSTEVLAPKAAKVSGMSPFLREIFARSY